LIDCELDVALVEGVVNDERITAAHWRDDSLRIIAHRRQVTVRDLNDQMWLMREPGSGTREVSERMMRENSTPKTFDR
jgi:LysR family transcriptional regulator, transcriptional activator of the cysJI operon